MPRRVLWLAALVVALGLCAATARPPRERRLGHAAPLLPRPDLVRVVSTPFRQLVTDYYWIQTVHAVGEAQTAAEYRDVYDYAMMVAALDPKFRPIYLFAGVSLPFNQGGGRWANVDESIRLLRMGVERFPDQVFPRLVLAYNLSAMKRDFLSAAKLLEETARLEGAPEYVSRLATRMYAQAGRFDAAEAFAQTLAESAEEPETRAAFQQRLKELELERALQRVDAAAEAFRGREGRRPRDVGELVSARDLAAVPADPLGGDIVLGKDGRAQSTAQQQRLTDFARPEGSQQVKP